MALPRPFREVVALLAAVFDEYQAATGVPAVLVGGAAVSLYTQGRYVSGDFDVVAGFDDAFDLAMKNHGFVAEHRPGHLLVGWYHPRYPSLGVQLVSGPLFDGRSDPARIKVIVAGKGHLSIAAIEDLIADRLGQFVASKGLDQSPLRQARWLARMPNLDTAYLLRRIRQEQGNPSLIGLQDDEDARPDTNP
jgi:hypothetical protein